MGGLTGGIPEVENKISWLIYNAASSSTSYQRSFRSFKCNVFPTFVSSCFWGFLESLSVYIFSIQIKDQVFNLALHLISICLDPPEWFTVKVFKSYNTYTSSHKYDTRVPDLTCSGWTYIRSQRSHNIRWKIESNMPSLGSLRAQIATTPPYTHLSFITIIGFLS